MTTQVMARWSFEPILESYLAVFALITLLILLLVFVRPAIGRLISRRRLILALLRMCLILMLVVAMLRPARVSTQSRPQSATIVLAYDESRSMQIEDASQGASRWTDQLATLNRGVDGADRSARRSGPRRQLALSNAPARGTLPRHGGRVHRLCVGRGCHLVQSGGAPSSRAEASARKPIAHSNSKKRHQGRDRQ